MSPADLWAPLRTVRIPAYFGSRLSPAQLRGLAEASRGWALSRLLCWVAGVAAAYFLGSHAGPHDPGGLTAPFGSLGDTLAAPAARWDAYWYLLISDYGYVTPRATVFFPLYPLTARVAGTPFASSLIGGVIVSLTAMLAALYLLHRLVTLESGSEQATRTMLLLAFFPTAVFFSAVYTEGLFLALSIGAFFAARKGRWAWAGLAGGLATMTRPTGVLLVVPLALLLLYGPREDRPQPTRSIGLRPRYPLGREALWLLAVPASLGCYLAYLAAKFGDPLVMLGQSAAWKQNFTFPLVTLWHATGRAATGAFAVFHGHAPRNVYEFGFLCVAAAGTIGALRRLPIAYGAYAAVGVLFLLSFPISGVSISSFSRYMAPLFPVLMWLAAWSTERRCFRLVLIAFGLLMVVNSVRFATWHFVA